MSRCLYTNIAEVSLDIRMKSKCQVALDEGFQTLETLEDLHIKFTNRENNVRKVLIQKCGTDPKVVIAINKRKVKISDEITNNLLSDDNYKFLVGLKKVIYLRLCQGFEVPGSAGFEDVITMNRNLNTIMAVSTEHCNIKKFQSVCCSTLVVPENHSSVCSSCLDLKRDKCKKLSRKRRNMENDIKPKTPNKYLSRGDLTKKLTTVTAQKTSLE